MEKNKFMRIASALLIAVLLTTCVISGTYAKYTTEDSAQDIARVAKWGVTLQAAGTLYGASYDGTNHTPQAFSANNAETVTINNAGTITNGVAPGTLNNKGLSVKLNGVSEVSGDVTLTVAYENVYLTEGKYGVIVPLGTIDQVTYNAMMAAADDTDKLYVLDGSAYVLATAYGASTTYYTLEDYVNLDEDYYPVEYKMTGTTTSYNTSFAEATTDDQLAAIVDAFTANLTENGSAAAVSAGRYSREFSAHFTPNTDLATLGIGDQVITWKWDICQTNDGNVGNDACKYCKADTILGNLQPGETTALNGTVVKYNSTDAEWAAPVAAAGTDLNDYNLEAYFALDIVVTQAD